VDPTGLIRDMSWAPVYVAYGNNNRSLMIRLPHSRDCVENRVPDISTNPYWAATIHLAAGLEGILGNLYPGPPQNENLYEMNLKQLAERGVSLLPRTLAQALDAFAKDPISEIAFGAGPKDEYLRLKWLEWDKYHSDITDWEWERYANFF
jgi:glutamine synthetase